MLPWQTVLSTVLLIGLASIAHGDITPGRPRLPEPPMLAPVKIVEGEPENGDPNVAAKIIIPRSLLPELRESISGSGSSSQSLPIGTAVAGLAMTAAAISLMFVNRMEPNWKKQMIGLTGIVLVVGIVLLANLFIPTQGVSSTAEQSQAQRLIVIEVQDLGHEVTLILPSRE